MEEDYEWRVLKLKFLLQQARCIPSHLLHLEFPILKFWQSTEVEDSATQLALLSSFYICLEFVCLSANLTPSDFEISDKLDTHGDNSLHFQSDSTSRNNPVFGSLKQKWLSGVEFKIWQFSIFQIESVVFKTQMFPEGPSWHSVIYSRCFIIFQHLLVCCVHCILGNLPGLWI